MDKEKLEELKQRARFLAEYKKRIEEAQAKQREISRLEKEIEQLSMGESIPGGIGKSTEEALREAQRSGGWKIDDNGELNDPEIKSAWEKEKELKRMQEKKSENDTNKAAWGCLGVAAFFFPIFWPIFLVQTFRAYPIASWTTLGIVTMLIVIISAST